MDSQMRLRWLLSGLFTVLVVVAAVLFDGGLRIVAVATVAVVYFVLARRLTGP